MKLTAGDRSAKGSGIVHGSSLDAVSQMAEIISEPEVQALYQPLTSITWSR